MTASSLKRSLFLFSTLIYLSPINSYALKPNCPCNTSEKVSQITKENQKPIAHAGQNKNVITGNNVVLSATASSDSDGEIISYQWQQTKGIKVALKNAKTASASFIAPSKATTLVFKLTVTDNNKARDSDSVAVKVKVNLSCDLPEKNKNNECVLQVFNHNLNDTGITFCSDGAVNVNNCGISSYARQDAEFGRDVFYNDDKDGHAGFSFSKVDRKGQILDLEAAQWDCVKDHVTGLLWSNGIAQVASDNDIALVIEQANKVQWCGKNNWQLPDIKQLQGIVDYGVELPGPTLDSRFFVNSPNGLYWSKTMHVLNNNHIWAIYFEDGRVFEQEKNVPASVRLISDDHKQTSSTFMLSDDGSEVLDTQSGLIWRRCVEGMNWDGKNCIGQPLGFMLQEALARAIHEANANGKNWRLPNIKELASIIDYSQKNLAIDLSIFPATPNDQFWSSSPYALDAFYGWVVHSYFGSTYYTYLEDTGMVRLVREP